MEAEAAGSRFEASLEYVVKKKILHQRLKTATTTRKHSIQKVSVGVRAHGREVHSVGRVVTATVGPQEIPVGHSAAVHCAGGNGESTLECYQNTVNCVKDRRLYPIGTKYFQESYFLVEMNESEHA